MDDETAANATLGEELERIDAALRQVEVTLRTQGVQSRASDMAILQELQRLQSGGAQRAMAGVYNKLFRDLLKHMNELDEFVSTAADGGDAAWANAITIARDRFEAILRDWGCTPVDVRVGEEQFDPERHEPAAVAGQGTQLTIREVRRRGWRSGGDVIQLPLVVVE